MKCQTSKTMRNSDHEQYRNVAYETHKKKKEKIADHKPESLEQQNTLQN